MQRKPVKSSMINSIGYDPSTQLMEVEFKNGDVYHYEGIKPHVHSMLVNSKSVGIHLAKHIAPNHKYKKKSPG